MSQAKARESGRMTIDRLIDHSREVNTLLVRLAQTRRELEEKKVELIIALARYHTQRKGNRKERHHG